MVNYCCVYGCGRNSKKSKHLYFYSVPKELNRQLQWLEAAGRQDLLEKSQEKRTLYRFCSRHFSTSSIKNKHLCADAVPTLCLPKFGIQEDSDVSHEELIVHPEISCNNCSNVISGFRYKCVTCVNYDLCSRCEMTEVHSNHFMLRIPTPAKFKVVEDIVKKWQQYHQEIELHKDDSSDDEPITKYVKNYDSGIDLTEDVKEVIRKEVTRALSQDIGKEGKKKKIQKKRASETEKSSKVQKVESVLTDVFMDAPEVAFADVNEIHSVGPSQTLDAKIEVPISFEPSLAASNLQMMQIKLNDDLSELIMEVSEQQKY